MITFASESFTDQLDELKEILPLHYEELALDKDKVPLDPQYDVYMFKESVGELVFYTARVGGELIGYFIGFVSPGLHYQQTLTCIMDIFYIHPDHRGSNFGQELFEFAEMQLRRRKVKRWYMGSKCHMDASFLFERIGADRCEVTYSKFLED